MAAEGPVVTVMGGTVHVAGASPLEENVVLLLVPFGDVVKVAERGSCVANVSDPCEAVIVVSCFSPNVRVVLMALKRQKSKPKSTLACPC